MMDYTFQPRRRPVFVMRASQLGFKILGIQTNHTLGSLNMTCQYAIL
jgi:hypothetical protein